MTSDASIIYDSQEEGKQIMKGLIIREPWIGKILDGTKDWEMRSTPASHRGLVGLIKKGSGGLIVAVANLTESLPPLDVATFRASRERHGIPPELDDQVLQRKWIHPWVMSDVRMLKRGVPSGQKAGAVTWVMLSQPVIAQVLSQLVDGQDRKDSAA